MHKRNLVIYIDVDDTLVGTVGTKRIPMPEVVQHVRALAKQGTLLFCWSSGGAEYARASARELGIEDCFFSPKTARCDRRPGDARLAVLSSGSALTLRDADT